MSSTSERDLGEVWEGSGISLATAWYKSRRGLEGLTGDLGRWWERLGGSLATTKFNSPAKHIYIYIYIYILVGRAQIRGC